MKPADRMQWNIQLPCLRLSFSYCLDHCCSMKPCSLSHLLTCRPICSLQIKHGSTICLSHVIAASNSRQGLWDETERVSQQCIAMQQLDGIATVGECKQTKQAMHQLADI